MGPSRTTVAAMMLVLFLAPPVRAQQEQSPRIKDAIEKGRQFLRTAVRTETNLGRIALATMALVKTGEPADSPLIKALTARLRETAKNGQYTRVSDNTHNYVAAVTLMALAAIDANKHYDEIEVIAKYLMSNQKSDGSWDYNVDSGNGDTSQSQYACLALWEALSVGVFVPTETWDKALYWFITRQDVGGGFVYHPSPPKDEGKPQDQGEATHSMSVAGAGTMALCRSQLPGLQRKRRAVDEELLIPVEELDQTYQPKVTYEMVKKAVDKAAAWMNAKFVVDKPKGPHFYYLYGVERYGALAGVKRIGSQDWYTAGSEFLLGEQSADGSWKANYPQIVDTSFALLFLGKSTEQTLKKIRIVQLGKGTMLGGRGLPNPEGQSTGMALRRKPKFKKNLSASVDELLKVLEDPTSPVDPSAAAVALETADPDKLIRAVGRDMTKLRKYARDEHPGVRKAALWALAKSKDFRNIPVLIDALSDSDPEVYLAARDGLRYLSRRIKGVGLPEIPPEKARIEEAAAAWRDWFQSLPVELEPAQLYDE